MNALGYGLMFSTLSLMLPSPILAMTSGPPRSKVDTIIIHAIGGPMCKGDKVVFTNADGDAYRWKYYFESHEILSIHHIVDRAGTVVSSIPEDQVAHHAIGHNSTSIGIELVNSGSGQEPYPEAQISALINLVKAIQQRWSIESGSIKRHSDVDTRTFTCGGMEVKAKQDPGANLKWPILERDTAPPYPPSSLRIQ